MRWALATLMLNAALAHLPVIGEHLREAPYGRGMTRIVAFPQIGDDVGTWHEPPGVVSLLTESAVAVLAIRVIAIAEKDERHVSREPCHSSAAIYRLTGDGDPPVEYVRRPTEDLDFFTAQRLGDVETASNALADAAVTHGSSNRTRITPALTAEVIEHNERGESTRAIAAQLDLGKSTLLNILNASRSLSDHKDNGVFRPQRLCESCSASEFPTRVFGTVDRLRRMPVVLEVCGMIRATEAPERCCGSAAGLIREASFVGRSVSAVNVLDPHSLLSSFGPIGAGVGTYVGAQTGYWIGRKAGPSLFDRPERARLHDARVRAEFYLARYGYGKAILLARFVPVVRTVLNPLAGVVAVPARTFAIWQVVGGLVWTSGVTLAGYELGSHITNVDHYLLPIVAVVVVLSLLPIVSEVIRSRRDGTTL